MPCPHADGQACCVRCVHFYESFPNRDDLLVALYDRTLAQLAQTAGEAFAGGRTDPYHMLRAGIEAPFQYLAEDSRRMQLLLVESLAHPALAPRRQSVVGPLIQIALHQGSRYYRVPADYPLLETAAHLLGGAITELLVAWHTGTLQRTIDQLVDETALLLYTSADALRGVIANPTDAGHEA